MAKQKFYVVWDGAEDGVYTSWEACQEAVKGYSNAKYKAFKSEEEAEEAYERGYEAWKERQDQAPKEAPQPPRGESHPESNTDTIANKEPTDKTPRSFSESVTERTMTGTGEHEYITNAIAVDAACSGNPGKMEYRGVYLRTGKEIFHFGPVYGTNNIGEFLAIVHGLALLKQKGLNDMPIYSDSVNAQLWVRKKQCKTTLARNEKTEELYKMIERAEAWLHNNTWQNQIIKWPTELWGEIPADFGRK